MSLILKFLRVCAFLAYTLLLWIHFVLKDHFHYLQVVFYAFPLSIIIIGGVFLILLFSVKPRTFLLDIFMLVLFITGIFLKNSYIFPDKKIVPDTATSVLFWNAADGHDLPVRVILESIKNIRPDIIGLVEATNATQADIDQLSESFPEYEFQKLEGGMLVGIKGTITNILFMSEPHSYDLNIIKAQLHSGDFTIAITDTFQDPSMNKRQTLSTVFNHLKANDAEIVVGDFNTPYESVHFNKYKKSYQNMRNYGDGFTATWLFGYPILEIDQIYIDQDFKAFKLEKFNYKASDHAMLVAYLQK